MRPSILSDLAVVFLKAFGATIDGRSMRLGTVQAIYSMNNLAVIQMLSEFLKITPDELKDSRVFQDVSFDAPLDLLQWMAEQLCPSKTEAVEAFNRLCCSGRLDAARWLVERFQLTRDDIFPAEGRPTALTVACNFGRLELVKWLIETFQITRADMPDDLLKDCHPRVIPYLVSNFTYDRDAGLKTFYTSCARGYHDVLKFLAGHYKFTTTEIRRDNLALIKSTGFPWVTEWLLDTYYKDPPTN